MQMNLKFCSAGLGMLVDESLEKLLWPLLGNIWRIAAVPVQGGVGDSVGSAPTIIHLLEIHITVLAFC